MTPCDLKLVSAKRSLCLLILFLLMGCGSRSTDSKRVVVPSPEEQIKTALQRYADSGELDSEIVGLQEQLDLMKESDPDKANALLSDLEQLKSMSNPTSVKKKAKEMLGKL